MQWSIEEGWGKIEERDTKTNDLELGHANSWPVKQSFKCPA